MFTYLYIRKIYFGQNVVGTNMVRKQVCLNIVMAVFFSITTCITTTSLKSWILYIIEYYEKRVIQYNIFLKTTTTDVDFS